MNPAVIQTKLFKVGDTYSRNLALLHNDKVDVIINQGGTSSAKTYSILQVLFTIACEFEKSEIQPTCTITVAGQDIPNLKRGALRQALEIVDGSVILQRAIKSYNKTDRIFTFNNGAVMEFNSYQDEQDARSGKRDYLFMNEANGMSYEIYTQLQWRTTRKVFLDYNPSAEFWVHEFVIGTKGAKLIVSDHRHNPFLSMAQHRKIENIADDELWKVYARGLTGKIEGLVYRNWHTFKTDVPAGAKFIGWGLDFGFTNDPTALVAVYMSDGELYVVEHIYQTGLDLKQLNDLLVEAGVKKTDVIIGDCAADLAIKELSRMGWNIENSQKGPGSINDGIDILKRYVINVSFGSTNLRKELGSYKWKTDRLTGKPVNAPVDFLNHALDALRYVALNLLTEAGSRLKKGRYRFKKRQQ